MLNLRLEETRVYQEAKAEGREQGRQEGREQGRQEGEQAEALNLVLRLLTRRLGQELPLDIRTTIASLPLPQLEELGEALLDFSTRSELETWLRENDRQ